MPPNEIKWLPPSTPWALYTMLGPPFRPYWLAPGTIGQVLTIGPSGQLHWATGAGGVSWPLLAPDGIATAPSFAFQSQPGAGLYLSARGPTLKGSDGTALFLTRESDPEWGAAGVSMQDALGGAWYIATWTQAPGDVRTAMYLYTPTQTEQIGLHMVHGSHIVSLSAYSHLHLVAHAEESPWPEVRWRLNGTDGSFGPGTDNVYDLGQVLARIRDLYLSRALVLTPLAGGAPTPATGLMALYLKSDQKLYRKTDTGAETEILSNAFTAAGDLLVGGPGGAPARLPIGANGQVLTMVAGTPTWNAPSAGDAIIVPLHLDDAKLPDGTTNNLAPQAVTRIGTSQDLLYIPKDVSLIYKFDANVAAAVGGRESLIWRGIIPRGWPTGNAITVVALFSMDTDADPSHTIRLIAGYCPILPGVYDTRALPLATYAAISADIAIPPTLGTTKEVRLAVPSLASQPGCAFGLSLSLCDGTVNNATGDRILEAAWVEFAVSPVAAVMVARTLASAHVDSHATVT